MQKIQKTETIKSHVGLVRKLLATALAVLLVIGTLPVYALPAAAKSMIWDGTAAEGFDSGTGTEDDPYCIGTAEALKFLSDSVSKQNKSYEGQYIKLTDDIVLNNIGDFDHWETNPPANVWIPIGGVADHGSASPNYSFNGCFDGCGYTISGLYINRDAFYRGLFGYVGNVGVTGATVKNVGITDAYITGKARYVGAVVGLNYGGTVSGCFNKGRVVVTGDVVGGVVGHNTGMVTNCRNSGQITGAEVVGGVVGWSAGGIGAVSGCSNTGNVSGSKIVGGVAGYVHGISECYNTGSVNGTVSLTGGVVGQLYYNTVMENCYNTGTVTGNTCTGGVTGEVYFNTQMRNCYSVGTVTGVTDVGGAVGHINSSRYGNDEPPAPVAGCYYLDTGVTGSNSLGTALSEPCMKNKAFFTDWNFTDIWTIDAATGYAYPQLMNNPAEITGGYSPVWNGTVATGFARGTGDEKDPYIIETAEQLAFLASSVNAGKTYSCQFFKLARNIVLNNTANWKDWTTTVPANKWTPIGSYLDFSTKKPFQGIFDGCGYSVRGLYISTIAANQGLFGFVSGDGRVKNVGVINSYVKGGSRVGGVVAYALSGMLTGCFNTGTICGTGSVGGVVGQGMADNCYNTGSVSGNGGTHSTGGVVGDGTALNSHNSGTVNGSGPSGRTGGVVGYGYGVTRECYNTGAVVGTGTSSSTGGVVGQNLNGTVENCQNAGTVNGDFYTGGVVGYLFASGESSTAEVSNCTNSGAVSSEYCSGGVIGRAEGQGIAKVMYCSNSGAVNGDFYTGGVVACNCDTAITGCQNTGLIRGTNSYYGKEELVSVTGMAYAGGIVGYNHSTMHSVLTLAGAEYRMATVTNCSNFGLINCSAGSYLFGGSSVTISIGGVIGYNSNGIATACMNSGKVDNYYNSEYAGGIVGYNLMTNLSKNCGDCNIAKCCNIGEIRGGNEVGGIIGRQEAIDAATTPTVSACYNTGTVKRSSRGYCGGIVGKLFVKTTLNINKSAAIENCYNTGTIRVQETGNSGNSDGGLVANAECIGTSSGQASITIKNCYNVGDSNIVGCLLDNDWPYNFGEDIISGCYYLQASESSSSSSMALTNAQMQTQATFTNWDFTNVWEFGDINNNYLFPTLRGTPRRVPLQDGAYSVEITGSPKVGQTLTAAVTVEPASANYLLQWYRDGIEIPGETEATYTVTAEDIQKNITVTFVAVGEYCGYLTSAAVCIEKLTVSAPASPILVEKTADAVTLLDMPGFEYKCGSDEWQTSSSFTGLLPNRIYKFYQRIAETDTQKVSPQSAELTVETPKATPPAPGAPTLQSKTDTIVTLTDNAAYEYKCDNGAWQISNVFPSLQPNTEYSFYQRVGETADAAESPVSDALQITTEKTAIKGTVRISGKPAYGEVLTADVSSILPAGASVSYQWYSNHNAIDGENASTYTVTRADIGTELTVTITGSGAFSGSITSSAVSVRADGVFLTIGGDTYYYVDNAYVTGYRIIDGYMYYFDTNGHMETNGTHGDYTFDEYGHLTADAQFVTVNNITYYITDNTVVRNNYVVHNDSVYYFGSDGGMLKNGSKDGHSFGADGGMTGDKQFITVNNNTYYISDNRVVNNTYVQNNNYIYYFDANGHMTTDGTHGDYTFDTQGHLTANEQFVTVNNITYYMTNNTLVLNTYIIENNTIYYFGENGEMLTDDSKDGHTFGADGGMIGDKQFVTVNNNTYYISDNRVVNNTYVQNNNYIYYFDANGRMATDGTHGDYTFDTQGHLTANRQFVTVNNITYYITNNTVVLNTYIVENGTIYYFGSDGGMLKNGSTDGHSFDADGKITGNKLFVTVNNNTYYIVNNRVVSNTYVVDNNFIYYLNGDGCLLHGGSYGGFTFAADGKMAGDKQFVRINNATYYMMNNAVVCRYVLLQENHIYFFAADGRLGQQQDVFAGIPAYKQNLSADLSASLPSDASVMYEWKIGDTVVSTDASYALQKVDMGKSITVRVSISGAYSSVFDKTYTVCSFLPGDINDDDTIELSDVVTLARLKAGWNIDRYVEKALDLNGDGQFDLMDVTYLAQNLASWENRAISLADFTRAQ